MKNLLVIYGTGKKGEAPPRAQPTLRLIKTPPEPKSERQRREEDELRALILSLRRRRSEGVVGRGSGEYLLRASFTEEDYPPAA